MAWQQCMLHFSPLHTEHQQHYTYVHCCLNSARPAQTLCHMRGCCHGPAAMHGQTHRAMQRQNRSTALFPSTAQARMNTVSQAGLLPWPGSSAWSTTPPSTSSIQHQQHCLCCCVNSTRPA
jgi:hypothetical protein